MISIPQKTTFYSAPLLIFALSGVNPLPAEAAPPCTNPDGWYLYCDGDCPSDLTQQGECTTRLEGGLKYCCCPDGFTPEDAGDETTPGGPPTDIGECPDEDKPPESSPWAASSAVMQTSDPGAMDTALYAVRDNVLVKNQRGKEYVKQLYRFSDDVDQLLADNPTLRKETTRLLEDNYQLLFKLGAGSDINVPAAKVTQASMLLKKYAKAAGGNKELKRAISRAIEGLGDRQYLQELGIRVTD